MYGGGVELKFRVLCEKVNTWADYSAAVNAVEIPRFYVKEKFRRDRGLSDMYAMK